MTKQAQRTRPARPLIVLLTQALFFLNAILWIVLGVVFIVDHASSLAGGWLIPVLMAANAAVLGVIGWGLGTQRWWFYYAALLVLLVNIVLGVTDDIGLLDVLVLALNTVMLVLLFIKRAWYTAKR